MKQAAIFLSLALLLGPASLVAELLATNSDSSTGESSSSSEGAGVTVVSKADSPDSFRPFSSGATFYGVSPLGLQFQFRTNLNRHLSLRSDVNYLSLRKNFSSEGWSIGSLLSMGGVGESLDFYPIAGRGLHFGAGVLLHNSYVAGGLVALGSPASPSFNLNGNTYYSSTSKPASAFGAVNLPRAGFTLTTGWGNLISRKSDRFFFPVEVGVAFLGSPKVDMSVNGGQVCDARQMNCHEALNDPSLLGDLQAQGNKYGRNLDLLRTFPIVSVGVAYRFSLRRDPSAAY